MNPKVSVITPLYNAKRFIPRLVETVQRQNGVQIEHIVVDDCSTDGSRVVLEGLCSKYPSLHVIGLSENVGPVSARNMAMKLARGRYLAFLDADDYWLPDKTKLQLEFMSEHSCPLSFTDYRFVSSDGALVGRKVVGSSSVGFYRHLATRSGLGCLTVMIDTMICKDFEFSQTNPVTSRAEDFFAWGEVIRKYGCARRVPYDLARYSVIPNSRSANAGYKAGVLWKIYTKVYGYSYPISMGLFLSFGFSAWIKRRLATPRVPIERVDHDLGEDWLDLVKLSESS